MCPVAEQRAQLLTRHEPAPSWNASRPNAPKKLAAVPSARRKNDVNVSAWRKKSSSVSVEHRSNISVSVWHANNVKLPLVKLRDFKKKPSALKQLALRPSGLPPKRVPPQSVKLRGDLCRRGRPSMRRFLKMGRVPLLRTSREATALTAQIMAPPLKWVSVPYHNGIFRVRRSPSLTIPPKAGAT